MAGFSRQKKTFNEENDDIFNLVTKVVVADKVKEDLCDQSGLSQTK